MSQIEQQQGRATHETNTKMHENDTVPTWFLHGFYARRNFNPRPRPHLRRRKKFVSPHPCVSAKRTHRPEHHLMFPCFTFQSRRDQTNPKPQSEIHDPKSRLRTSPEPTRDPFLCISCSTPSPTPAATATSARSAPRAKCAHFIRVYLRSSAVPSLLAFAKRTQNRAPLPSTFHPRSSPLPCRPSPRQFQMINPGSNGVARSGPPGTMRTAKP